MLKRIQNIRFSIKEILANRPLGGVLICLSLFITISACDEEEEDDFQESATSVKEISVPDSVGINELFALDLIVFGSSGCAEFSRFIATENGDTTIFELFQKRDSDLICTTSIIDIPVTIIYQYENTGRKYLKFNTENSLFSDFEREIIDSVLVLP